MDDLSLFRDHARSRNQRAQDWHVERCPAAVQSAFVLRSLNELVERLRESKRLNIARTGTEAALFQVLVEPRQHALQQVDPM